MKAYLLDTNIALIALTEPDRIAPEMRRAIESGQRYLSVISYWEVLLKSMKNKLRVGDLRVWWMETLDQLRVTPLWVRPDHISYVYLLPDIHQDPFDRLLIAQASVEGLTLVTTDSEIPKYGCDCLHLTLN